jgi:hypothetical protein
MKNLTAMHAKHAQGALSKASIFCTQSSQMNNNQFKKHKYNFATLAINLATLAVKKTI